MKKLDTLLPIIKSELFLGVVTLVLVGVVCVAFQHLVIKKLSTPRTPAQPVHKVIIEGKQMTKTKSWHLILKQPPSTLKYCQVKIQIMQSNLRSETEQYQTKQ